MNRLALRLTAYSLLLVAVLGCQEGMLDSEWKRIEPRVSAADFTLPGLDGKTVSLSELRGRVVIMEFWATWCGPCRFSLPSLEVIYGRYRHRGVTVLLLNQDETADVIKRWAEKRFTAPILLDAKSNVAARYGVEGIPRLFIVDRNGRLIYEHAGYGGGLERSLRLILEQALAEPLALEHG